MIFPVSATMDDMLSSSDKVILREGLTRTVDIVTTTSMVYPGVYFLMEPGSADPAQADRLRNNYSIFDHSNSYEYPGYNDCDAWSNLFQDGWSASYTMTASLDGDQAQALLIAVDSHWRGMGLDVERLTYGKGEFVVIRLTADLRFSQLQLDLDPRRDVASITGTTECLPPE
jgi:hypothetical protein